LRQLRDLRDELPPSRRTPLMSTLAAHLLLAGHTAEMCQVAEEAIDQGAAIGLTAALAWTVEAVALLCATEVDIASAARLAGYARAVHPSIATRMGGHKAVTERLNALFADGLPPDELALALSEGGRWTARTAAEQARLALRAVPRSSLMASPESVREKPRLREEIRHYMDRLANELTEAREQQLGMMPDTFPCPSGGLPVRVHAAMRSAREVGGDFYDCFEADGRTLCIAVGDVAGKGMPAALFMARARSLLRTVTLMLVRHLGHTPAPDEVAVVMNEELCKNNSLCNFLTLFVGLLDTPSGTLRYVNAGHVRPYLLPRAADPFEYNCPSDVPLGFEPAAVFRIGSLTLSPGDALVVVSDGVHDMLTAGGVAFGRGGTLTCLAAAPDRQAKPLVSCVMAAVLAHGQGAEQADDVTVLALHVG
jgi:sigma-B regulation protein RsbU (phosphoserine phosphatase)